MIHSILEICGGPHVTQHTYGKDDDLYAHKNIVQLQGFNYTARPLHSHDVTEVKCTK